MNRTRSPFVYAVGRIAFRFLWRRRCRKCNNASDSRKPSSSPTSAERQTAIDFLRGGTLADRAEDLQFVLINNLEFLFV